MKPLHAFLVGNLSGIAIFVTTIALMTVMTQPAESPPEKVNRVYVFGSTQDSTELPSLFTFGRDRKIVQLDSTLAQSLRNGLEITWVVAPSDSFPVTCVTLRGTPKP